MTNDQATSIGRRHRVFVDLKSEMYRMDKNGDYAWYPIPAAWKEYTHKHYHERTKQITPK